MTTQQETQNMTTDIKRAVLGADDREMKLVRKAFELAGIPTVDAQAPGPLAYQEAYTSCITPLPGDVWVECRPLDGGVKQLQEVGAVVVDHHNPGDPESPSILQVIDLLTKISEDAKEALYDHGFLTINHDDGSINLSEGVVVVGQADHDLAHFWKNASDHQKSLYLDGLNHVVRSIFADAVQAILDAPDYQGLADLRDDSRFHPGGTFYPSNGTHAIPIVTTAALAADRPYLAWGIQGTTPKGRHVSIRGANPNLDLREILVGIGAQDVVAPPGRGFALGYVPWT